MQPLASYNSLRIQELGTGKTSTFDIQQLLLLRRRPFYFNIIDYVRKPSRTRTPANFPNALAKYCKEKFMPEKLNQAGVQTKQKDQSPKKGEPAQVPADSGSGEESDEYQPLKSNL